VLVSKNPINIGDDLFRDMNDIEEFMDGGRYKYAVGKSGTYNEIAEYSKFVKNRFPDAFVVGVVNGKVVSVRSILKKLNK
ncbi:MAG: hypothetical protein MI922_11925, partial [Bacteroidales bacterium]|nr:hypothetical protein [Bacteroidales bacterium]